MKNNNTLYMYFHVPKCAGTTVRAHIERNFKYSQTIPAYINFNGFFNYNLGKRQVMKTPGEIIDYISELTQEQRDRIKVIYGHNVTRNIEKRFDRPIKIITFLRNPVQRLMSHYLYHNKILTQSGLTELKPFREWFNEMEKSTNYMSNPNLMVWYLSTSLRSRNLVSKFEVTRKELELAKKFLDECYFVGLTEFFDEDSLFVFNELGINYFTGNKNVSKNIILDINYDEIKQKIHTVSALDIELYEYALMLNRRFKKERNDFYEIVENMQNKINPQSFFKKLIKPVLGKLSYVPWAVRAYGVSHIIKKNVFRI